jgi:hypothetical protein
MKSEDRNKETKNNVFELLKRMKKRKIMQFKNMNEFYD